MSSQRAFRNPQGGMSLGLRIRTRGAVSIVYDCVWWWREEFGGQPNTYSNNNNNNNNAIVSPSIPNVLSTTDSQSITEAPSFTRTSQPYTYPPQQQQSSLSIPQVLASNIPPPAPIDSHTTDNMADWGDQMLVDLGWDIFDDFSILDQQQRQEPITPLVDASALPSRI